MGHISFITYSNSRAGMPHLDSGLLVGYQGYGRVYRSHL